MLCKPFFTEEDLQYDQNITLIGKNRPISEKQNIADIFNKSFINITKTLNIPEWKPQKVLIFQSLNTILDIFSSYLTNIQIRRKKQTTLSLFSITFSPGNLKE